MTNYCKSITSYARRATREVSVGAHRMGGKNPVVVQTMTNTLTTDTDACVAQIGRIAAAGGRIVRLTTPNEKDALNLGPIGERVRREWPDVALVADVHFLPAVAAVAATTADKVRINPGNYNDRGGRFEELIELCRERGVALRIGVNHGSLAKKIFDLYGDTPEGMAASAMEFLRRCRELDFHNVVVSLKSSNVRVMVYAYRLLVKAMNEEGMDYPVHLGVTEAGNHIEGREVGRWHWCTTCRWHWRHHPCFAHRGPRKRNSRCPESCGSLRGTQRSGVFCGGRESFFAL